MLTWKPKCGKNHGSPKTAERSLGEKNKTMESTEATTSCTPSSPRGGYNGGNNLSLSLSLSIHCYTLYNYKSVQQHKFFCPKSYLYTYDFRAIYTYGPKGLNRTQSCMCPFQPDEEGYHQAFNHPVLLTCHLEGPVSQHIS